MATKKIDLAARISNHTGIDYKVCREVLKWNIILALDEAFKLLNSEECDEVESGVIKYNLDKDGVVPSLSDTYLDLVYRVNTTGADFLYGEISRKSVEKFSRRVLRKSEEDNDE